MRRIRGKILTSRLTGCSSGLVYTWAAIKCCCLSVCVRYDWSIVTKVAENFLLDRVIGRQMGLEYSDIFQSLLARNMRCILTKILAFLEDLDLIR